MLSGDNVSEAGQGSEDDRGRGRQTHGGRAGTRVTVVRADGLGLGARAHITVGWQTNIGEGDVRRRDNVTGGTDHLEPVPVVGGVDEMPAPQGVPAHGMQSDGVINAAERGNAAETVVVGNTEASVATVRFERRMLRRAGRRADGIGRRRRRAGGQRAQACRQRKCDAEHAGRNASGSGSHDSLLAKPPQPLSRKLLQQTVAPDRRPGQTMKAAECVTAQGHRETVVVVADDNIASWLLRSTVPHVKSIDGEHAVVVYDHRGPGVLDELAHMRKRAE